MIKNKVRHTCPECKNDNTFLFNEYKIEFTDRDEIIKEFKCWECLKSWKALYVLVPDEHYLCTEIEEK